MNRRTLLLFGLVALAAIPTLAALWLAGSTDDDGAILVFAPSSLAPIQAELDAGLAADDIGPVEWVFAGSQSLVAQLVDGAPGDALITADRQTFDDALSRGVGWSDQRSFASNHLTLATPADNPADITAITDVADPGLVVGVCAVEVPCGRLAAIATAQIGLEFDVDTEETSVRALTAKLSSGELDAGLVYRTDALAAGLHIVDPDALADSRTTYWATASDRGRAVLDFLTGPDGTSILTDAGFGP